MQDKILAYSVFPDGKVLFIYATLDIEDPILDVFNISENEKRQAEEYMRESKTSGGLGALLSYGKISSEEELYRIFPSWLDHKTIKKQQLPASEEIRKDILSTIKSHYLKLKEVKLQLQIEEEENLSKILGKNMIIVNSGNLENLTKGK